MKQQQTPNFSSRQQRAAIARQMQHRIVGIFQLIGAVLSVITHCIINIIDFNGDVINLIYSILSNAVIILPGAILPLLLSAAGGENEGSNKWNRLLGATAVANSLAVLYNILYLFVLFNELYSQESGRIEIIIYICMLICVMQIYIGQMCLCLLRAGIFSCCKDPDTEAQSTECTSAAVDAKAVPSNETVTSNDDEKQTATKQNPVAVDSAPPNAKPASNNDDKKQVSE